MSKVYIGESKFAGKGVFAKNKIKKGEIIFIVKGRFKKLIVKNKEDALSGDRWMSVSKNRWIDPFENNPWFFINHSCEPNAGVKGNVTIRALKNIGAKEEITIDYSTNEPEELWSMRCSCGSKKCRKVIRGALATEKKVIREKLPFVSNYVRQLLKI